MSDGSPMSDAERAKRARTKRHMREAGYRYVEVAVKHSHIGRLVERRLMSPEVEADDERLATELMRLFQEFIVGPGSSVTR